MNRFERHERILKHLSLNGFLSVTDGIALLDASPATLRRDFNALAAAGVAERTHGGLRGLGTPTASIPAFEEREIQHSDAKAALAARAAALLSPGDTVIVDGGTTTVHLARSFPSIPLRVITNSLRFVAVLSERGPERSKIDVLVAGGYLSPSSWLLVGPQANANLARYHARWLFLSAAGVDADGVYNTDEFVVESERIMIANADRIVLMADHSKLGVRGMCRLCPVENLHLLITDDDPSTDHIRRDIAARGVQVETIPSPTADASRS